jgi:signal transduction histidine kinase
MRASLIAGLLLCVAMGPTFAQTPAPSAFDERIAQARSAMMADPAAALAIAQEAESLAAGPADDPANKMTAQWLQGEALNRLNRSQEAIPILDSALSTASIQAKNTKLRGDVMMARAGAAAMQGDYARALANFQGAHDVFADLGEARSQSMSLLQIGAIYFDAGNYRRALEYYLRAGEAYSGDASVDLSRLNNVANAQRELGNLKEAEAGFREALAIAVKMDSPMLRARIMANIAAVQIAQGQATQADALAQAGLQLSAEGWEPFLWGVRAQAALARGDAQRAAKLIERTFAGQDFAQTPQPFRDFHKSAHEIYVKIGDEKLALRHLEAFKRLDDEGRDVAASANTALMGAQFDFASQELKITKLRAETLEAQQRQRTIIFFGVGALALVVLGALAFGYVTMRGSRNRVRAANVRLSDTNLALEKAIKAKSEFLATTSHEIRTPLNGILGMTQVLLMDKHLPSEVRERVQIVHGAGESMRAIVDDILDVAKMESGGVSISLQPFPLKRMLEDVCSLWRINAEDKGIAFSVDVAGLPAQVSSDEQRLRQIVFNLMSNAVKFTDAGRIGLRAAMEGDVLVVEVSDTGFGIPADQLEGIFEAFHQVDGGTTRKFGGTGLGLAICRNLARALGGDVSVTSTLGVGSVFTLRTPVLAPAAEESAAPLDGCESGGGRLLLALEDNPFHQCMLEACCAELGLQMVAVEQFAATSDALRAGPFEIVAVAASALPSGPGEAMGALMALREAARAARLIVQIGEGGELEAPVARLCGADEVLIGAFDADAFLAAIGSGVANTLQANAA